MCIRDSYGAIAVAKNSPYKNFKDVVDAYNADSNSIKMAGGSVRGRMHHLIGALAFQAEDGIRDAQESRGLGDVYKRQSLKFL